MATDRLKAVLIPLALCTFLAGCGKVKARMEFKQGNASYKSENYREAIRYYKQGLELDPAAKQVWRSVGLSAMAVYRPGDTSKQNLEYAEEALGAFEKFAAAYPEDQKVQDYILTILMSSERFDDALKRLRAKSAKNPGDKETNQAIVTVLIRAGKLDEAIAYVKTLGARADGVSHYTVGVACWDKAYRDPMLSPEQRGGDRRRRHRVAAQVGGDDPGLVRFAGLSEPHPAREGEARSRSREAAGVDCRSGHFPG